MGHTDSSLSQFALAAANDEIATLTLRVADLTRKLRAEEQLSGYWFNEYQRLASTAIMGRAS